MKELYLLPKFEIAVDDSLGFIVKVYGCFLQEDHLTYLDYRWTVRNVTISRLAKDQEDNCSLCCGVDERVLEITGKLFHHVVATNEEPDEEEQFPHKGHWRAKGCSIVYGTEELVCGACKDYVSCITSAKKAKGRHLLKPAHLNAPISKTDPERIKLTLKNKG